MWERDRVVGWVNNTQEFPIGELLVQRETLCDVTGNVPGSIYFIILTYSYTSPNRAFFTCPTCLYAYN